jgi:uncharacterized protein (DUF697 family)
MLENSSATQQDNDTPQVQVLVEEAPYLLVTETEESPLSIVPETKVNEPQQGEVDTQSHKPSFLDSAFGSFASVIGVMSNGAASVGGALAGTVSAAASTVGGTAVGVGSTVANTVSNTAGTVGNAVINTGSSAAGAVSNAASTVGNAAVNAGGAVVGTVSSAAGAVGNAVVYTGSSAVGAASSTASAISNAAVNAGGAVVGTVSSAAGAVGYAAASTGSAVVETVANTATGIAQAGLQVTDGIGYILDLTSHSELLKSITSKLNLDWLLDIIDAVDVVKAETHVKQLKKKYPLESPSQIVDRLISEKALYVGFSGFGTSIIPGIGAGLFAVDLATTSACKAELVYQLACAYNFDLRESSRKGEAMAVFSLAFGGSYAVKAGLGLVRGVPLAGAVIGATSNSAILLVIGHVAKQFYEAKLNASISKESLERTQSDSEDYLKKASEQQNIIDQILIHVAIAGCPRKNSKEIFKELKTRGFNPTVLAKVGSELKHLPALEELIGQLENDFKKAVLGQCHVAANLDQVITPGEAKIIKKIQDSIK